MHHTADYMTFFSAFADLAPISLLSFFFLALTRIAPLVAFAPFLGAKLPGAAKMGLAISLTIILLPHVIVSAGKFVTFGPDYIAILLKEFLIGMIIAILSSIPFYIAESAGTLIDFLRGSSALAVTDPIMQTQISPIGLLYNYVLIVMFFQIEGPVIILDAFMQSYDIVPADQFVNSTFFSLNVPFWQTIVTMLTRVTAVSIQLAAPSLLAILMTEMFLGIANRLAPQVQIAFLGMSVKSLVGIALLWAAWFFILKQMGKQSTFWLQDVTKILPNLKI